MYYFNEPSAMHCFCSFQNAVSIFILFSYSFFSFVFYTYTLSTNSLQYPAGIFLSIVNDKMFRFQLNDLLPKNIC